MAKNGAWKLLSHLVDILILFPNNILLSIFWLEICWDVVNYRKTPVWQVWWGWFLPTGR